VDEAATAAFGSDDVGDAGSDKAEAEDEGEVAMRIPVDWGGEYELSFCGLRNVGNTCFLNSVGMLLVHCPCVFWHCMFAIEQRENSEEQFFRSRGRYDDAIKQLVFGVQGEGSSYTPIPLIRLTRALMPDYRQGTQQDAHEYMRLLLSAWAEDYGLNPKDFMQSPAYGSFGGCYSQVCRCLTCSEESRSYSADLDLSVEIMQYMEEMQSWNVFHDLNDCFRSYFKRSKMIGENQWFCPKCKENRDSEHGLAVYSPPPFLCVNLKRFSNDVEKINHHVQFPQRLNLEPYMDPHQEDGIKKPCHYKLSGVVVHHGRTIRDGHYTSYCLGVDNVKGADAKFESDSGLHSRKKGGKQAPVAGVETAPWFKFDDDVVTKVDINAVLDSEAYILMYTMIPEVVHHDRDIPQWVLPAIMHKETRAAQAQSRTDPDAVGDDSFNWYTSEAVGVVVSLWTLLLGLVMYNTRNSVQDSAHIVLNFFSSIENDYVGIMVVPLLLGMVGFLRSISYGLNDGGFYGFRSAVLGYFCGFMFHVACCVALATMFKGEKSSSGDRPSSSSTPTVMGRWSSDDLE